MPERAEQSPAKQSSPGLPSTTMRRRTVVGIVSVSVGVLAMVLLTLHRDRIRTHPQERACREGDARLCLHLSEAYGEGRGVRQNADLARQFRQRAVDLLVGECRGGDGSACFRAGELLQEGDGSGSTARRAEETFERGCEAGTARACLRALALVQGEPPESGGGSPERQRKRRDLARKACMAGDVPSCLTTAQKLLDDHDRSAALALYGKACSEKSGEGCYAVAKLMLGAASLEPDLHQAHRYAERARPLLEAACAQAPVRAGTTPGRTEPCGALADLLDRGLGGPRELGRVRGLLARACQREDAAACTALRGVGLRGEASGRSDAVEADALLAACERQGAEAPKACTQAAERWKLGWGVKPDAAVAAGLYGKAERLRRQACEQGDARVCEELAALYAGGGAVAASPEQAIALHTKAHGLLRDACDGRGPGAAAACCALGALLRRGNVVRTSPAEAKAAFGKACEKTTPSGDASCCREGAGQ